MSMNNNVKVILFIFLSFSNLHTSDHLSLSLKDIARTKELSEGISLVNNLSELIYDRQNFPRLYSKYEHLLRSNRDLQNQLDLFLCEKFEAHMWHEISQWKKWKNIKQQRRYLKNYECDFNSLIFGCLILTCAYTLYHTTDLDAPASGRINIEVIKLVCIPVLIGLGYTAIYNSVHPSESILNRINALELNYKLLQPSTNLESKIRREKFNESL